MRTTGIEIDVDLVHEMVDIGELAKAGRFLGYDVVIERGDERLDENPREAVVRFQRTGPRVWGSQELEALVVLSGLVGRKSGNQILAELKARLEAMHFPMDRPLEDVMGIGEGPGHAHHDAGDTA
jgi:hypothetical protein